MDRLAPLGDPSPDDLHQLTKSMDDLAPLDDPSPDLSDRIELPRSMVLAPLGDPSPNLLDLIEVFKTVEPILKPTSLPLKRNEEEFEVYRVSSKSTSTMLSLVEDKLREILVFCKDPKCPHITMVSPESCTYSIELDRLVLNRKAERKLSRPKCFRLSLVLEKILLLCKSNLHLEIRELLYSIPNAEVTDRTIIEYTNDIVRLLDCPRADLRLTASSKGLVAGRLIFKYVDKYVDCSRCDTDGINIPNQIDKVSIETKSDALFILLVEKNTIFSRLLEDKFHEKFPCIIISGSGQPSVVTRMFLRKVAQELNKPVFALIDCNFGGFKIMCTYLFGSKKMAYDSEGLTTPGIRWLGLPPSQVTELGLSDVRSEPMSKKDLDHIGKWMKKPQLMSRPKWVEELGEMAKSKKRYDLESVYEKGIQYISNSFLPDNLMEKKWI